ncbi:hypothetical protein, partial [Brevundimonas sp.]|uniref:hypothetical protein n=1 Tax=Brevundimonas sp. TaxID=1871086 RepID=UPI00257E2930
MDGDLPAVRQAMTQTNDQAEQARRPGQLQQVSRKIVAPEVLAGETLVELPTRGRIIGTNLDLHGPH